MKYLVFIALLGIVVALRDQSIAVKGKLLCGSKPASNVRVKLWEEDGGPDPDDELDQGYTNNDGEFHLSGGTTELTPIDPIFKVYHNCDDNIKPGHRKLKFKLPKSYITEGKTPKKIFDIGVLNLETIFPEEEREMIVSRMRRAKYRFMENNDS
uniref:Transthyretin-like family protein n=1 Tax=Heterorhabditis bacteriophora TaxID=37862 RepID=A0A1I7XP19_HETBA